MRTILYCQPMQNRILITTKHLVAIISTIVYHIYVTTHAISAPTHVEYAIRSVSTDLTGEKCFHCHVIIAQIVIFKSSWKYHQQNWIKLFGLSILRAQLLN